MRSVAVAFVLVVGSVAFGAPPQPTKELIAKGKASFDVNCAACHGPKGAGDGPAAVALNPKPRNYTTDVFTHGDKLADVYKSISEGLKDSTMVAFAQLPERERWALAYYVLELRNAGKPAQPVAASSTAKTDKPNL